MSTMIQNPNEIEAFTRRQRALARIHRNITEKFQLNRRQFISGSLATMALAALGLSGCAPKTPAASTGDAAPAFTPGTYEATAQGRNGEIKVSVTFEADRVASIEADHMESRNIGDAAVRLLTDNYLETQKLSVDTVTGATLTSMAFATAVAECAEAAGADMRAIMKGDASVNAAEPISDEADVVVIGSGGAALAAAVTAAEAGKSVVMLEKMDIYGGNTNAGEGTLNAPDPERRSPWHRGLAGLLLHPDLRGRRLGGRPGPRAHPRRQRAGRRALDGRPRPCLREGGLHGHRGPVAARARGRGRAQGRAGRQLLRLLPDGTPPRPRATSPCTPMRRSKSSSWKAARS